MNEFKDQLQQARQAQRKAFIIAGTAIVGILLFVVALIGYVNGTPITIKPKDASEIAKLQIVNGIAGAFSKVVYSMTGDITVLVMAGGFASQDIKITSDDRGKPRTVTLVELPGKLIATTVPPADKNRWTVDGQQIAIAPSLTHTAPAGKYRLETDNQHFEIAEQDLVLRRGKTLEVAVKLNAVKGRLDINSRPDGAEVRIDGKGAGTTPLSLDAFGGLHRIEIRKDGFESLADDVEITNTNRDISRNYRLEPVKALISFDAKPKGGALFVNGRKQASDKQLPLALGVPHTLRYSKAGYFPKIKKVTFKQSSPKRIEFRLKLEMGAVDVRSRPSATVLINGKSAGQTPLSLQLPATPQRIVIKRSGYREVSKKATPSHKRTTIIDVKLQTERAARLAESPESYQTDTGISLKLFQPKLTFQMGAPRHQKGQRANEFIRNIKLTRPFYASLHEITNGQFRRFSKDHNGSVGDKFPATSVTWLDAAAFCNWLSKRENLAPFYRLAGNRLKGIEAKANGYRLLSEAEWEWLARKAGKSQQTVFPWGNTTTVPSNFGNIADEEARGKVRFFVSNFTDGFAELAPVGSFRPESSGLFDLTGNAAEWVHDVYSLRSPTSARTEVDPLGIADGPTHVAKGSSWRSGTRTTLRAAYRDGVMDRRDDLGFRIGRYL